MAFTELFRQYAGQYYSAAQDGRSHVAQNVASHALGALAGLFPDPNDPAHVLILGLCGALFDARSGSRDHILLTPGKDLLGMKHGLHHAYMAGFCLSAVRILCDMGITANGARTKVAKIMADLSFITRIGKDGRPKPITGSAIRSWSEQPEVYPAHHLIAARLNAIHRQAIANQGVVTEESALEFLKNSAAKAFEDKNLF